MFLFYHIKNKGIYFILLLSFTVIYISLFIITGLGFRDDEGFTMALIHHSFSSLVKLDSYDVHPPFYYLVLRLFLLITTFWTKSLIIKIIFARIFSLITFLVGFRYLIKMINIIGIKINLRTHFLTFVLLPSVLSFSTQIRMYSLGMCLLVLELYESLLFIQTHKNANLLYLCIWSILSAYTHYFVALFSGIFILVLFCIYIYKKDFKDGGKFILIGCLLICLYLPWLFYTFSHLYTAHHQPGNFIVQLSKCFVSLSGLFNSSFNSYNLLFKLFTICVMYMSLSYCIMWSLRHLDKLFNSILLINLVVFILILIIGSLADMIFGYEFSVRFVYPSFIIISFMWIVILYIIRTYNKKIFMILFFPLLLIIILNMNASLKCVYHNYACSQKIISETYSLRNNKNRNISVKIFNAKMPNILTERDLVSHKGFINTDEATTLFYLHKNMIIRKKGINFPLSNGNKFGYKVWPNIKKSGKYYGTLQV